MRVFKYVLMILGVGLISWTGVLAQNDEWPQVIELDEAKIVVYQPQPESFEDDHLSGRAAVSVTMAGEENPVFGAIWFEAKVVCDRVERMCAFEELAVPVIRFPESESGAPNIELLRDLLEEHFPDPDYQISMDRLLASLDMAEEERSQAEAIKTDAPVIFYREEPTILVLIDGEPQLRDFEKHFQRVINQFIVVVRLVNAELIQLSIRSTLHGRGNTPV